MIGSIYNTLIWRTARARALARDGSRCTVARLLGGECRGPLHVHHLIPVESGGDAFALDNLGTACESHHPAWEALRRSLVRAQEPEEPRPVRCRHRHATAEAREICERRMRREARERGNPVAA
jgi:hypothetical protein